MIKDIGRKDEPDYLFIEPSEMVTTKELINAITMGLRDYSYDTGPLVTLVDGPMFKKIWNERRGLLTAQVEGADLVAISRSDLLIADEIGRITDELRCYPNAPMILSSIDGLGVESVLDSLNGHLIASVNSKERRRP